MRNHRLIIAFTALLSIGVLALPAAAAPSSGKGKPSTTQFVDVTLAFVGPEEGLATECDDADGIQGSLRMERKGNGLLSVEGIPPLLNIRMAEVEWSRQFPESTSGAGLAGCHGGTVTGSPGDWQGLLSIGLDSDGNPTDILWHFDYYVDSVIVERGKKTQERPTIREHWTLNGPLTWDPATSTASGDLYLHYYFNDYVNDVQVLYEPFLGNPRPMAFTMTITPAG